MRRAWYSVGMVDFGYDDALALALAAHRGQRDKVGEPYIRHVVRVAETVSDDARIAALLHDVLEDGDVAAPELVAKGVPEAIVATVETLTRRDGEPYEHYIERVAADPVARAVKLADLADNLGRLQEWTKVVDEEAGARQRERYTRARERLLSA